jgi:hypothetical protein
VKLFTHLTLGFGGSKLAVTRLHAPNGFTDQTSPILLENGIFGRRGLKKLTQGHQG